MHIVSPVCCIVSQYLADGRLVQIAAFAASTGIHRLLITPAKPIIMILSKLKVSS